LEHKLLTSTFYQACEKFLNADRKIQSSKILAKSYIVGLMSSDLDDHQVQGEMWKLCKEFRDELFKDASQILPKKS